MVKGWLLFLAAGVTASAELRQDTLSAWNSYLRTVEARTKARLESKRPFLWIDEDPGRTAAVRNGEIAIAAAGGLNALQPIDHGLIHDWIGGIFIAGSSIDDVFTVLRNFGSDREIDKPVAASSYSMQWAKKVLFVTAALEAQYESHFSQFDSSRWYSRTYTTRLQEITGYGSAHERKLPPDEGPGFIWRLYGITRYQQRDGGVYLEVEALALSRDIPFSMQWFVKPAIDGLSRRSLASALLKTRDGVRALGSATNSSRTATLPQSHTILLGPR